MYITQANNKFANKQTNNLTSHVLQGYKTVLYTVAIYFTVK